MEAVSLIGVLVASLVGVAIGSIWYSPFAFGNIWMRLSGLQTGEANENKTDGLKRLYLLQFIFTFISAYALAHFAVAQKIGSLTDILALAFWIWLGFQLPISLASVLWEKRPFKLFVIHSSQYLIAIFLMAVTIALIG